MQNNSGESNGNGLPSAHLSSSNRKVETQSVEDRQSNGAMTLDPANATIKTEGHGHHKHHHHHKKHNDKSSKNTRKIQFDESVETPEEELNNMTEEEIRSRRKEANIMALIKKAATKSQASISED